ncbi:MAG: trypsin-like peptidase domain-containing protein [Phycisphaerae bacterium]
MTLTTSVPGVLEHVFLLEAGWQNVRCPADPVRATGFSIGLMGDKDRLVLATAAHVFEGIPFVAAVNWRVAQYDRAGNVTRECRFEMRGQTDFGCHRTYDLAWLRLPLMGTNGQPFAPPNEPLLPLAPVEIGFDAGTPVGWAGYPLQVERELGRPTLCYYEGVVSACTDGERMRYVVDGHAAPGVSGGPVWTVVHRGDPLLVIGVVSSFGHDDTTQIPGFCLFEPINRLSALLESQATSRTGEQGA